MIYLDDLFNYEDFMAAVDNGYVRLQHHNAAPLVIANYTEQAQFERAWDKITLNCRGLIFRRDTRQIVARPFPKFFNHDEPDAPHIGLDELVSVTDKMDGSCGILYPVVPGSYAIATRGSFHSEQAEHATALFQEKYADWTPADHLTYLFEVIYPENRIVCNYGEVDDLFLLGAVSNNFGHIYGPSEIPAGEFWPGPRTKTFPTTRYGEALSMPPREGMEGIVIRTSNGRMVKLKQDDYKALHRIITGLNARSVWDLMVQGKTLAECVDGIPDEFHGFVREVFNYIRDEVDLEVVECYEVFDQIKKLSIQDAEVFGGNKRKAFALLAKDHPLSGYLFRLYDGKDIRPEILKNARPAADWTPVKVSADTA